MNLTAYNLDSLRTLVRNLQKENRRLKAQLDQAHIAYATEDIFVERLEENSEYDPDQGGRIRQRDITVDMAQAYHYIFCGRSDVFARRGKKGGYYPQCENHWNDRLCPRKRGEKQDCNICENKKWTHLTLKKLMEHLAGVRVDGTDVLGIYPLFPDGTCRLLVFDFDNHEQGAEASDYANTDEEWHEEVDALRTICEQNGISPLVERSRSGKGAHVWIFFNSRIPAALARNFGFLLMEKGMASVNVRSFRYYDRMFPAQSSSIGIGNLIALPLQGRALKNGNSAFVDRNWNAYPDQWDILRNHTRKITIEEIQKMMAEWQLELTGQQSIWLLTDLRERPKPWRKKDAFRKSDVVGKMHIVLRGSVYVDGLNLLPEIQNQIRGMAAFDNPEFYKKKRLGYFNYYNASMVYLGKDQDGYISIPRGLKEELLEACGKADIPYEIQDEREKGRPIRVSFNGDLRTKQNLAAQKLLAYDCGILSAATAFGKTVVCSYLIAERKVNTLILIQNKELLEQWVEELNRFLILDEEPPLYQTKGGRQKRRDSAIGVLHGGKNTLTGIVDVAMIGSVYHKGEILDTLNSYGMVIMDECHHCASNTAAEVMKKVNARYVYGVSATVRRTDQMEKITYMLLGPVRHVYTAKERAAEQGIGHYVYPRFTRVTDTGAESRNMMQEYALIAMHTDRNEMIIKDTKNCICGGRTPVILTRLKEQAKYLYEQLQGTADYVYVLYGDNSDKENAEIRRKLTDVPGNKSLILVATGSKIGEGFNFPRLDTLMLAAPVSSPMRLEQYAGRINRDYVGKKEAIIYDYVDSHISDFDKMYAKRLRIYKRIGYSMISNPALSKQEANAIYDSGNYTDVFERDLVEAEKQIVISSPELSGEKIQRFLYLIRPRQEMGCAVTVITENPENVRYGSPQFLYHLISELKEAGVHVIVKEEAAEHFAVLDEELVWHGGMNLLGKVDAWDNLMRIKSASVAAELLELSLGQEPAGE